MATNGVFISYRREESAGFAGRLYDRLVARFGRERVFMDVEGIDPGTDFVDAIERAVASCAALIVVIGPRWSTVTGRAGKRRLDDPQDFVRLETAAALKRSIRVLPVLVDGAEMPKESDLPEDLVPLLRRQAIEINHKHWESSTSDLLRALAGILDEHDVPDAPLTDHKRRWGSIALFGAVPLIVAFAFGAWMLRPDNGEQAAAAARTTLATAAPDRSTLPTASTATEPTTGEDSAAVPPNEPDHRDSTSSAATPATPDSEAEVAEAISVEKPIANATTSEEASPAAGPSEGASPSSAPGGDTTAEKPEGMAQPQTPPPTTAKKSDQPQQSLPTAAPTPAPSPRVTPPRPTPLAAPETAAPTRPPPAPPEAAPIQSATPAKLPQSGEQWTYAVRGLWATNRERTYVFSVEATDGSAIRESMAEITNAGTRSLPTISWIGAKPEVIQRRGKLPEFNPYIAAFDAIDDGTRWRGISTPSYDNRWDGWNTTGRIVGSENVSVPAGQFRAQKADIWSNRHATGGPVMAGLEPVSVHFEIWFAPGEKRYVKLIRTIKSAAGGNLERDTFQLVSVKRKPESPR